jgi:hypothetical protein
MVSIRIVVSLADWRRCQDADLNATAAIRCWPECLDQATCPSQVENSLWRRLAHLLDKMWPVLPLQLVVGEGAMAALQVPMRNVDR